MPVAAVLIATALLAVGCTPGGRAEIARGDSARLTAREARLQQNLATPDSGDPLKKPIARWVLPKSLGEISGMAVTADGRLLVHNDEIGRIQEINYRRGSVGKHFVLGSPPVKGDFEGITVAHGAVYLLASNGRLFEFHEGANAARVQFHVHDTGLGRECEFEGVAFDPAINSLLLACKMVRKKSREGSLLIYRWKLDGGDQDRISELAIPLDQVIGSHKWKGYNPSDIAVDPSSGNYVLVSAQEEALVELTPAGQVVSVRPLPKVHTRTEGVAITKDNILIVSDEAAGKDAAITLYRWR